jgi:hypothetical protein
MESKSVIPRHCCTLEILVGGIREDKRKERFRAGSYRSHDSTRAQPDIAVIVIVTIHVRLLEDTFLCVLSLACIWYDHFSKGSYLNRRRQKSQLPVTPVDGP